MVIDNFFAKQKVEGFANWNTDKTASNIMKSLLKASFEQNPQALQRLLATGNATLTHTQDKGKWGTEFPRLLMEVREELRQSQPESQQQTQEVFSTRQEMLNTMVQEADGFIGEVSQSPYTKVGNKFVIKNNTEVEKAVNYISKRGVHKDRKNSLLSEESIKYLTEDKDNTSYYNIGYNSGEPYITAVTNRELFDESYTPKTIMFLRDQGRLNEDIIKTQLKKFKDTSTFLVDASDTKAIEFFDKNGYNYKVYQVGQQQSQIQPQKEIQLSTT